MPILPDAPADHTAISPSGGIWLFRNTVPSLDGTTEFYVDYYDNGDRYITSALTNGWFPAGMLVPNLDPPPEEGMGLLGWGLLLGAAYLIFRKK